MRCEDTSAKLADYLGGTLSDAERQALESHAASCPTCREEIEGAREMWQRLGRMRSSAPDTHAMRARFDAMMADAVREQEVASEGAASASTAGAAVDVVDARAPRFAGESAAPGEPPQNPATALRSAPPPTRGRASRWMRRHRAMRPLLQAAAAAILVVVGIQAGRQMSTPAPAVTATAPDVIALRDEVRDLRQMVTLSLMQQQSVTERLKGVSWSNQLDQPGNEVVSALIDTLMHDANVNVRLASIDALKRFATREVVRSAAVQALDTQNSPLVQMALIDFVVETQDREALDTLRKLSRDDQANEAVRVRASWGIDHLEAA
jgi:putative zinc finger protein/HEAT repeat protein